MPAISLNLTDGTGVARTVEAQTGLSVMEALEAADLMAGECGGSLACASCHIWLDSTDVERFPEPTDDEEDMLDTAFFVTETSRLSCQLILSAEHDGLAVTVPSG